MIKLIDHWVLHRTHPAFDDKESLTVLELVGRHTVKINELIEEINKTIDTINNEFEEFKDEISTNQECFKEYIEKIVHDYISMLDEKIKQQDIEINNAINYMKDNFNDSVRALFEEMKENGELDEIVLNTLDEVNRRLTVLENKTVSLAYNEDIEELNLVGDDMDETVSQVLEGEY